jgi:hypothetical protein
MFACLWDTEIRIEAKSSGISLAWWLKPWLTNLLNLHPHNALFVFKSSCNQDSSLILVGILNVWCCIYLSYCNNQYESLLKRTGTANDIYIFEIYNLNHDFL